MQQQWQEQHVLKHAKIPRLVREEPTFIHSSTTQLFWCRPAHQVHKKAQAIYAFYDPASSGSIPLSQKHPPFLANQRHGTTCPYTHPCPNPLSKAGQ